MCPSTDDRAFASDSILAIQDASVSFGAQRALDGLSFCVRPGAVAGIIGPNGSGKTTLLRSIMGLTQVQSGDVLFQGNSIVGLGTTEIVNLGIGLVPQHAVTLNGMSVLENVLVGFPGGKGDRFVAGLIHGKSGLRLSGEKEIRARSLLGQVGLKTAPSNKAGALSFGQKKRLDIARTLAGNPRLILLDEPTAGLDAEGVSRMIKIIRRFPQFGISVLLVEHNLEVVKAACDYAVVLDNGRKIAEGVPVEVLSSQKVIESYLGVEIEIGQSNGTRF